MSNHQSNIYNKGGCCVKRLPIKFFLLSLVILTAILLSLNVFADSKNNNTLRLGLSQGSSLIADEEKEEQDNFEVKKNNEEVIKIIKEEVGIDLDVKKGILSYDPEKAFIERNNKVVKIIREVNGIVLKEIDGILEIDAEETETNNRYKLSGISLKGIAKPDTLLSDYPYESGQIGEEGYTFSKYLFKLNTEFSSHSEEDYHADFYSQNDSYMFTISGNNVDNIYYTSVNINDNINSSYNDINSYYIIMHNNIKINPPTSDLYYFIYCLTEQNK